MIDQDLLATLESAASSSTGWFEISDRIEIHESELPDSPRRALVAAFQYLLKWDAGGVAKHSVLDAFEPMMQFQDGDTTVEIPPRPSRIDERAKAVWAEYGRAGSHPALASRLNDLAFCGGVDPGVHLDLAIKGYLATADVQGWDSLAVSQGLVRALHLARSAKLNERMSALVDRSLSFVQNSLEQIDGPGVVLPILETLIEVGSTAGLQELLDRTRNAYRDPFVVDQVIGLQLRLSPPEDRAPLGEARVDAWEAAAADATPIVRVMRLETALKVAEEAGLSDRVQALRARLQETNVDDLGMRQTRATFQLPSKVIDEFLAQFTSTSSQVDALAVFFQQAPPTGSYEENVRALEELQIEAPLAASIPRVIIGGDGLPRWKALGPEQEYDGQLTRIETQRAQLIAPLLELALSTIGSKFPPNQDALAAYLGKQPTAAEGFPNYMSESLQLYWEERYTAAAYLALPLIEAQARALVLKAGRGIYRLQRNNAPGQYPGLGALLTELGELGLPPSWVRYYASVFSSPAGMNLRNEVAHGFVSSGISAPVCAMILHAAGSLSNVDVSPART